MRPLIVVAIALILAAIAFFAFRPAASNSSQTNRPEPTGTATSTTKVFNLVVQNRTLVSGPSTLGVTQNDNVTINITVDENEELHLHGYNLHVDLEKGKPGSLSFVASTSGRFPYELEHSSTEIGALEVQPN